MNLKKICTALTDWLIIALFFGFIFVPFLFGMIQTDKPYSETEKRPLVNFPSFSLYADRDSFRDFARKVDKYYQDHFGLREFFIYRHHREMMKWFDIAGISDVVIGKEEWFFYEGNGTLKDLMGRKRLSQSQLEMLSLRVQTYRQWLREKGIYYLQVVAPNKESIYSEYLPDYYQLEKKETRLDQVIYHLNKKESSRILDLRPVLISKKGEKRLYDKTDTHWNILGAYYAYREIIKQVQVHFPDQQFPKQFEIGNKWRKGPAGDLAVMAGQENVLWEMRPPIVSRLSWAEQKIDPEIDSIISMDKLQPSFTRNPAAKLRVIVLHDSFMNAVKPFLSESFGEVLYIAKNNNSETIEIVDLEAWRKIIDLFQPDIVIDEIVERNLDLLLSEGDIGR